MTICWAETGSVYGSLSKYNPFRCSSYCGTTQSIKIQADSSCKPILHKLVTAIGLANNFHLSDLVSHAYSDVGITAGEFFFPV